jgi:hypothetical protein
MSLEVLIGEWTTRMLVPQAGPIHGWTVVEPLFGEHFVTVRNSLDHPEAPESLIVIGPGEDTAYRWHYFDARGVSRDYKMTLTGGVWSVWREDPDFWQRYTGRISADGRSIDGAWEISEDQGTTWRHDFGLTYTKV